MNQRGEIKSFGVLKTATIGGIVTAAFIAVPMALILVVFTFLRVIHHSTHNTAATPATVVQQNTVATPNTVAQPNQHAQSKPSHPVRFRGMLFLMVVAPLVYGIFGFLLFALWSWLYNVLSPRFGRIEIELTESGAE